MMCPVREESWGRAILEGGQSKPLELTSKRALLRVEESAESLPAPGTSRVQR